ncbi:MAG: Serine/threonine-protein kinase PknB [Planctomycetota bacterium]|jgi:serine/threonine protein kinase
MDPHSEPYPEQHEDRHSHALPGRIRDARSSDGSGSPDETQPLGGDSHWASHDAGGSSHRSNHASWRGSSVGSARYGGARDEEAEGDELGPYKLLNRLGEGGFGTVWLARRTKDYDKLVAIKVLKRGRDSTTVLERFNQEVQLLALLDHPHIAKVIDAGKTRTGRPYFVMEYVKGCPLVKFANEHRFTIQERLQLFIQVCEAVQFAHYKEIVHRDLKPSNILVEPDGNGGATVKVIDFGIAMTRQWCMSDECIASEAGQMVGTYEYMCPEQAMGEDEHISQRSDVYALGVILYELLVGATPFASSAIRGRTQDEIRETICSQLPPSPRERFVGTQAENAEHAQRVASFRRLSPKRLARVLGGELGWIPLKAMRKNPADRYASPARMAEDIRNYLARRTVEAVPPTAVYRARKYVRRQRVTLVMGCCMMVALGSFARQLIAPGAGAMTVHPDAQNHVDMVAKSPQASRDSVAFALQDQRRLLERNWGRLNELRNENSEDRRRLRALEQSSDAELDMRACQIAIEEREQLIGAAKRERALHLARQAWFEFRLGQDVESGKTMSQAIRALEAYQQEYGAPNPEDARESRLFNEALRHYEVAAPDDPPPALWQPQASSK